MFNDPNLIAFEQLSPRRHKITLLVLTRPDRSEEYLAYFRALADAFAYTHKAKLNSDVDVELNPFRESAVVVFEIKGYKRPEKHAGLSDYFSRAVRMR